MKGEAISVDDCIAINRKVNAKLIVYSEKEKEAMSIQDMLDQVELSPAHRLLISSRLQTSQGTTLDKVALRIMGGSFSTHDGQSADYRIDGGNQALATSLAARSAEVICNAPVIEIKQDLEGVIVRTEHDEFLADKVVLSVPVSVINKIKFTFSGEHTSPDWSGTMNGALQSGVIAAEQILAGGNE